MKRNFSPSQSDLKKLVSSLIVFIILILSLMSLDLFSTSRMQESLAYTQHTNEVIQHTERLRNIVSRIELIRHQQHLRPQTSLGEQEQSLITELEKQLDELMIKVQDNEDQVAILHTWYMMFTTWLHEQFQPSVSFADDHQLIEGLSTEVLMPRQQELLSEFITNEQRLLDQRQQQTHRYLILTQRITISGDILLILILVLMTYGGYRRTRDQAQFISETDRTLKAAHDTLSQVIEATNVGTWVWDLRTGISEYNERWAEMIGYTRKDLGELPHDLWRTFIHPDDIEAVDQRVQATLSGAQQYYEAEFRMRHRNGNWVWIMDRGKVTLRSDEGRPLVMSGTHSDITIMKQSAEELEKSEQSYRRLVDQMNQGLVVFTTRDGAQDLIIESCNRQFGSIVRRSVRTLGGSSIRQVIPMGADQWISRLNRVAASGNPQVFEITLDQYSKSLKLSAYVPEEGKVAAIVEDISKEKRLQNQLRLEKVRLETTLLSVGDAVISTNVNGFVVLFNNAAERLTGWLQEQAIGKHIDQVFSLVNEQIIVQATITKQTINASDTALLTTRQGHYIAVEATAAPIVGTLGSVDGVVVVFRDNSVKRQEQQHMETMMLRDPLTGLRNRRAFDAEIKRLDQKRYYPLILVVADVNNLKLTNDAFGHDAGDELLRQVAKVLVDSCRETDIIARIGGDEFILLLPNTDVPYADLIINRMNETLAQLSIHDMPITVSFGHALKESQDTPMLQLFQEAETGMYRKKIAERPHYRKAIVDRLLGVLYQQHPEEQIHGTQVAAYCRSLALRAGMTETEVENIAMAGTLHDIGKIALSHELLEAEGLTDEIEGITVMRHPEVSYNILSAAPQYASIGEIVLAHHERLDGSGYPSGSQADQIPMGSRILAVCDHYALLTLAPPAGLGLSTAEAISRITKEAGSRFDATVVNLLLQELESKLGEPS